MAVNTHMHMLAYIMAIYSIEVADERVWADHNMMASPRTRSHAAFQTEPIFAAIYT